MFLPLENPQAPIPITKPLVLTCPYYYIIQKWRQLAYFFFLLHIVDVSVIKPIFGHQWAYPILSSWGESEEIEKGSLKSYRHLANPNTLIQMSESRGQSFTCPKARSGTCTKGHMHKLGRQPEGHTGTDGLSLERMKEVPSEKGMGTVTVSKANIKDCFQVCTKTKERKRQCCLDYPPCLFTPSSCLSAFGFCLEARSRLPKHKAAECATGSDHGEATVAPRHRYYPQPTCM